MCPVKCRYSSDCLAADRVAVPCGHSSVLGNEVDSSSSLWVPAIGRKVLVGLSLCLLNGPSLGFEGAAPHRAEAALMGKRRERDPPAFSRSANDVVDRDHCIAQEDLVKGRMTIHLAQWSCIDARLVHGQDHPRDALVLGRVPVRPSEQHSQVGMVGTGAPHLLSVDDEDRTVLYGGGRQPSEVRSTPWFAEQLAPGVLACHDPREKPLFQRCRTMRQESWSGEQHSRPEWRPDCARRHEFLFDDIVGPRGKSTSAQLPWPGGARPPCRMELTAPDRQLERRVPV